MNATQILSEEHQNILKVIAAIEKECEKLDSGQKIDEDFFTRSIDFIRNYADKFHHAKEEDILFKEFCKDTSKVHCNPVDQMLHEHNVGREFVKGMEKNIKNKDKKKLAENARGYARLLQEHIFKEDNILYPMTDEAIDEKRQKSMLKQFDEAEKKFSKGTKEKYVKLAKEFETRK